MKNKKGFTLLEVIGVVAVLALIIAISLPVFSNIKSNTLKREFQNVKSRIELAAEQYANDTRIITVSVGKLIEEGYLSADDQEAIYNPVTNESLNCNIVELTFSNGTYNADLTENSVTDENGACSNYEETGKSIIAIDCYSEDGNTTACENTLKNTNSWYSGSVKLTYGSSIDEEITNYRWSALTGESSTDESIIVTTDSIKSTVFSLSVTYKSGIVETGNIVVQIDNQSPIVIDVVKDDSWSSGEKKVLINASDYSGSGIEGYVVANSNDCSNATFQPSNEFSLGKGTYYACVKDKAGNISEPLEFEVKNIDMSSPSAFMEDGAYFTTVSSTFGITYYSELSRKITFEDNESGVSQVLYCFTDEDKACTPDREALIKTGNKSEAVITYEKNKNATKACAMAIDKVGNKSDVYCDDSFLVDTTAPDSITVTQSTTNSSVLNVSATDSESGIYGDIVCKYGTSSSNLDKEVSAIDGVCNLGRLSSGVKYYVKVATKNNANLDSNKEFDFTANITMSDAYTEICEDNEYCNDILYIKYNNYLFVVYRKDNGYKAIYNGIYSTSKYLSDGCCNEGHCTYDGINYSSSYVGNSILNGSFLNKLTNYQQKLNRGVWYTGYRSNVTARTVNAYVGLMDYNEYSNTKSKTWVHSGATGSYFWLLTPYDTYTSGYLYVYKVMYNGTTYYESAGSPVGTSGVRPVIVFKGDVVFTSGSGTLEDPYVI